MHWARSKDSTNPQSFSSWNLAHALLAIHMQRYCIGDVAYKFGDVDGGDGSSETTTATLPAFTTDEPTAFHRRSEPSGVECHE